MMIDEIIHGDLFEVLPSLPEKSIDLVFADPPYNLQLKKELRRPNDSLVDAVNDDWDKFADFAQYDAFTLAWLSAVRRLMKPHASIWVSGTYHNIFRVGAIMQTLGFWLLNTLVWHRPNAMPNFRGTRLKNDVEFVIWAKYSETSRYTFNHHLMKVFNEGKQLGSLWQIPVCGGEERLRDATGKKLHPTQKPEELLKRILLASAKPDYLVLDPFSGTGTTAAMAKSLHMHYLGIESDERYIAPSRARLARQKTIALDDPLYLALNQSKAERVSVQQLLEAGYLQQGQVLALDTPPCEVALLADGSLDYLGEAVSIHKLGKRLKQAPSCNGWKHWYYEAEDGQRYPIDRLREEYRLAMAE